MGSGGYGDFWTWVHDEDVQEKIFRVWDSNDSCFLVRFVQLIEMSNGDFLIGMQACDEENGAMFFRLLSQLRFAFYPSDQMSQE